MGTYDGKSVGGIFLGQVFQAVNEQPVTLKQDISAHSMQTGRGNTHTLKQSFTYLKVV